MGKWDGLSGRIDVSMLGPTAMPPAPSESHISQIVRGLADAWLGVVAAGRDAGFNYDATEPAESVKDRIAGFICRSSDRPKFSSPPDATDSLGPKERCSALFPAPDDDAAGLDDDCDAIQDDDPARPGSWSNVLEACRSLGFTAAAPAVAGRPIQEQVVGFIKALAVERDGLLVQVAEQRERADAHAHALRECERRLAAAAWDRLRVSLGRNR